MSLLGKLRGLLRPQAREAPALPQAALPVAVESVAEPVPAPSEWTYTQCIVCTSPLGSHRHLCDPCLSDRDARKGRWADRAERKPRAKKEMSK